MLRTAPRPALAFFAAAVLVAFAAIAIAATEQPRSQTVEVAVHDAAGGLPTGKRMNKPL
jgi:ABC-type transporter Mla subunit MlaD